MLAYAKGKLRMELQLRGLELNTRMLAHACMWSPETGYEQLVKALEGVVMPENAELSALAVEELPHYLRPTYELWARGADVSALMRRATWYRHRRALQACGVDISQPPVGKSFDDPEPVNVVPFARLLEGHLEAVPAWAVGTPLYYEPAPRVAA